MNDYYFSLYMYFISCFMLFYFYKHLLMTVISLEFMMVFLIFNMFNMLVMIEMTLYMLIFMLTLMVCEGVLSLSIIVLMVRFNGNDYLNSLIFSKW